MDVLGKDDLNSALEVLPSFLYHHRARWASTCPALMPKLLEEAFRQQVEVFDFLAGRESYKLQWTKQVAGLYRLSILMSGLLPWLRDNSRKLLRKTASLKLRRHN